MTNEKSPHIDYEAKFVEFYEIASKNAFKHFKKVKKEKYRHSSCWINRIRFASGFECALLFILIVAVSLGIPFLTVFFKMSSNIIIAGFAFGSFTLVGLFIAVNSLISQGTKTPTGLLHQVKTFYLVKLYQENNLKIDDLVKGVKLRIYIMNDQRIFLLTSFAFIVGCSTLAREYLRYEIFQNTPIPMSWMGWIYLGLNAWFFIRIHCPLSWAKHIEVCLDQKTYEQLDWK